MNTWIVVALILVILVMVLHFFVAGLSRRDEANGPAWMHVSLALVCAIAALCIWIGVN